MTIGKKLFIAFGAASALALAMGVLSHIDLGSLGRVNDKVVNVTAKKRYLSSEINMEMASVLAAERGVLLRDYMKDRPTMEQYNKDFYDHSAAARKKLADFTGLAETADERQKAQEIGEALDAIRKGHDELWNDAISDQLDAATEVYKTKTNPAIKQVVKNADALTAQEGKLMQQAANDAQSVIGQARWIMAVMGLFSLLVATGGVFVVRQINQRLRKAVADMREGAQQVASAAGQVAASSQSQAQASSEQASSLEETSSAAQEIDSMARKNSESSLAAAELVKQSQHKFDQTNQTLQHMVVAMTEINSQSDKISKIIKVIDEIAFQTNILALNAAVEAARAGEAGMGFAVVADEVRNLAQRCAQAAKDTTTLIEESIGKSNEGKSTVDQVVSAIRSITEDSTKVKTLVDEVSVASGEQVRGIEQISASITQIERVTQGAAASSEEGAAAAAELNAQSQALGKVVDQLTSMVGGGPATSGPASISKTKTLQKSRPAVRVAAPKPAPKQKKESGPGLVALQKAVSRPAKATKPAAVLAGRQAAEEAFPMDDDFQEF